MHEEKRRRALELAKTIVILALILTAVLQLGGSRLWNTMQETLSGGGTSAGTAASDSTGGHSAGLLPVRLAVMTDHGRCGLQYDEAQVSALFKNQLGNLLGEVLGGAGTPQATTSGQWQQALTEQGVYYDFLGCVPLEELGVWLGGQANHSLTDKARQLILTAGSDGKVLLWYRDGESGACRVCTTEVDASARLEPVIADCTPNQAMFAFEDPDQYGELAPDTMLLAEGTAMPVFSVSNPAADLSDSARNDLLTALEFHPKTSAFYQAADGLVVRESSDTLRISNDGVLTYHSADTEEGRYFATDGQTPPTIAEAADTTRTILEAAASGRCGAAGFYCIGCESTSGGGVTITYGYVLEGAQVAVGEKEYAARFVCNSQGVITDYTIHLRCYEDTGETSALLPERQALAALAALGCQGSELLLQYSDPGGDQVSAGWIAR